MPRMLALEAAEFILGAKMTYDSDYNMEYLFKSLMHSILAAKGIATTRQDKLDFRRMFNMGGEL